MITIATTERPFPRVGGVVWTRAVCPDVAFSVLSSVRYKHHVCLVNQFYALVLSHKSRGHNDIKKSSDLVPNSNTIQSTKLCLIIMRHHITLKGTCIHGSVTFWRHRKVTLTFPRSVDQQLPQTSSTH
jgi:hypothetical protein